MRRSILGLALLGIGSCGGEAARPTARTEDQNAALGGEVAARVGSQPISLGVVASVAEAQKVTPAEALRKLIDDEIAASAARAVGREKQNPTAWRLVAARARFTADQLASEARRQGPPTDEEVELLTERHWVEVDRPPTVRVVHAIVMRPKDRALSGPARELARELKVALASATNQEFEAKAKAFPYDSKRFKIIAQPLPAFTEDGRVAQGSGVMDTEFSKAAFRLDAVGATSDVVESSFGFHVIRLLERIPEKRMPFENRRLAFTEEVLVMRARERMDARLEELRAKTPIRVSPAAETLMRAVKITRESAGEP